MRVAGLVCVAQADGDDEVAETLACGGVHEHFAAAPAFDVGDSDEGEEEVADAVAGGEEARHAVVEADGFDEDGG